MGNLNTYKQKQKREQKEHKKNMKLLTQNRLDINDKVFNIVATKNNDINITTNDETILNNNFITIGKQVIM